jgi:hypothetical protein
MSAERKEVGKGGGIRFVKMCARGYCVNRIFFYNAISLPIIFFSSSSFEYRNKYKN